MNKLINLALCGAAALAMATSCSSEEDLNVQNPTDGNVSFTVKLPGSMTTRAFGDGTEALKFQYAVYQKDGDVYTPMTSQIYANGKDFVNLESSVDLKLVNGKTYTIIFWAQSADCNAYTLNWGNRTFSVDYTKMPNNVEANDAFYAVRTFKVTGPINETIELYRPLAQINLGSNDLQEDAVKTAFGANWNKLNTQMTVSDVYSTFDFIKGDVVGTPADVTFAIAGIPSGETFPYEPATYEYINMAYVLTTQAQSTTVDVKYAVSVGGTEALNTVSVTQVPIQGNYQTNIFGQILTENAHYNVIIKPAFKDPDNNQPI